MEVARIVVGVVPLLFVVLGLASTSVGVLTSADAGQPVGGTLLVLVGLTLFGSLWLVGWGRGGSEPS